MKPPTTYTRVIATDGEPIIVPTFMADDARRAISTHFLRPDIEHHMTADKIKADLLADLDDKEPFPPSDHDGPMQSQGLVMVPVNPSLTKREILSLHAEVKALQIRYGLSYKDAAHRLYLAELEKLKAQDTTINIINSILSDIKISSNSLLHRIKQDNDSVGTSGSSEATETHDS